MKNQYNMDQSINEKQQDNNINLIKNKLDNALNELNNFKIDVQNKEKNVFKVPDELKLSLDIQDTKLLEQERKKINLQKIVNDIEDKVGMKIKNIPQETNQQLNGLLQMNIKEELKQNLLKDVKKEVKDKITDYINKTIAKNKKDNVEFQQPDIFENTVPPFYRPGISLP